MKYTVVVEQGLISFGANVPDLPGCVAVAETKKELLKLIQEAIEFDIEGLREDGQPIPSPSSSIEFVEVRAAIRCRRAQDRVLLNLLCPARIPSHRPRHLNSTVRPRRTTDCQSDRP